MEKSSFAASFLHSLYTTINMAVHTLRLLSNFSHFVSGTHRPALSLTALDLHCLIPNFHIFISLTFVACYMLCDF